MTNPLKTLAIASAALFVFGVGIAAAGIAYLRATEDEWRLRW